MLAGALLAAPGLGLTFALFRPGEASIPVRLALVVPFGYAFIGLSSLALALAGALTLSFFVPVYVVGTAAAWLVAFRRGGIHGQLRTWRSEISSERWPYLLALGLFLVLASARLTHTPLQNLYDQTPLRYWADGLELADAHGIPATSLQWGQLFLPTVSKVVLNAFNGTMSLFLGRGPLAPMGGLLLVLSLSLFLAGYALARELGLRLMAPLLVVLVFANRMIGNEALTEDLAKYRAENWGRLLLLAGVMLAVRSLRARDGPGSWRDAIVAGVLFGVCAGTHLVPLVVGVAMVTAYLIARMALDRRVRQPLARAAVLGGVALVLGLLVLASPRGDIGFQGTSAPQTYRTLAVELGFEPEWDPTLYLARNQVEQAPNEESHGFYRGPLYDYSEYARRVVGVSTSQTRYMWYLPAGAAISLAVLLLIGSRDLKALGLAALLAGLALLAGSLYFSYRFDVFVIAEFGPRRLFDYSSVPVLLLGLAAAEAALLWVGDRLPLRPGLRWRSTFAAAALVTAVVAAVTFPSTMGARDRKEGLASALGAMEWIRENVPCEGRILADRRTLATFETLTRRAGAIEGMGPYLRPDVLSSAVRQLLSAREFFLDPENGEEYLRQQGVAAVVLTGFHPLGGTLRVAEVDEDAIRSSPFLRLAVTAGPVRVYEVIGFDPAEARYPDVRTRPGYLCRPP